MIKLVCVFSFALFLGACASKSEKDIHFFVAGGVSGPTNSTTTALYEPLTNYLSSLVNDKTLDFGVFTGNMVRHSNDSSWTKLDLALKNLPFDIHRVPGFRDLGESSFYINKFGNSERHFVKSNNFFQIWEVTNNGWNVSEKQLKDLKTAIAKKGYDNVFVFVHPVSWYDQDRTPQIIPNNIDGRSETSTFYTTTLQQLNALNIPVYVFSGGVGEKANGSEITIHKFNNVHLIASGMGGGKWDNILQVFVKDGKTHIEIDYMKKQKNIGIDTLYVPVWI